MSARQVDATNTDNDLGDAEKEWSDRIDGVVQSKFGLSGGSVVQSTSRSSASAKACAGIGSTLDTDTTISKIATISTIKVGCKVYTVKDGELRKAELLSFQSRKGEPYYYVHYQDFNKRLDEWIPASKVDFSRPVEFAKSEKAKKVSLPTSSSLDGIEPARGSTPRPAKAQKSNKRSGGSRMIGSSNSVDVADAQLITDDPATINHSAVNSLGLGEAIIQTEAIGGSQSGNGQDDIDQVSQSSQPTLLQKPYSKEAEIEKLRTSGSMTQNAHEIARVKNFSTIVIGKYAVEPWYFSPYPKEFTEEDCLWICEFCLLYFGSQKRYTRHRTKCKLLHPPGNEIYRHENLSFFEIDGRRQRTWCRNLCLLSKLFLDHKTLYYDVDPFLFYCMTFRDEYGCHLIGYFSKEKESAENYNVACILTLPQYQRLGFGKILISFSYELSKKEGKAGSPEKPLSDLGLLSYRAYWSDVLVNALIEARGEISIDELAHGAAMTTADVLHTLQNLNLLKYYKGQHIICLSNGVLEQNSKQRKKNKREVIPSKLVWTPPNFSREQLRYLN